MNRDTPNILIGTLYSGENEFEECVESLKKQTYTNWDHFVLKNLSNKEAHETLYQRFMSAAGKFDLFIKLDADMVFASDYALLQIVKRFRKDRNLGHGIYPVHDFYTNCLILGMHVFSSEAKWHLTSEEMFVDPKPTILGRRKVLWDAENLVKHSPNPSKNQAFSFGIHRAAKIFQKERNSFSASKSLDQMRIINYLYKNYSKNLDERLKYAVKGTSAYLKNGNMYEYYKNKKELIENFDEDWNKDINKKYNLGNLFYELFKYDKKSALKVFFLYLIQTINISNKGIIRSFNKS